MSDQTQAPAKILLNIGDDSYDLMPVVVALAYSRDFVVAQDVQNGAKNVKPVRFSPLVLELEKASGLLREIFDKHGQPVSDDEPVPAEA